MNFNQFRIALQFLFLASFLSLSSTFAADLDVNADAHNLALHGYDPVAYFTLGQPTKGSESFQFSHKNVNYYFASAENRDLFKAQPDKYRPQYGGFCAYGVTLKKKLDTDPTAWKIVDGKLYVNVNKDVFQKWSENIPGNIKKAESIWPEIKHKKASDL